MLEGIDAVIRLDEPRSSRSIGIHRENPNEDAPLMGATLSAAGVVLGYSTWSPYPSLDSSLSVGTTSPRTEWPAKAAVGRGPIPGGQGLQELDQVRTWSGRTNRQRIDGRNDGASVKIQPWSFVGTLPKTGRPRDSRVVGASSPTKPV